MKSPITGKEMSVHKEWRILRFRNQEFKILSHTYKCSDTEELFEDEKFANLNYLQLVNQYRALQGIPFQKKIAEIRQKYEVSAVKMSEILGFGQNSYRLYEQGEIPSQSNARLIQLVENPHEFGRLLEFNSTLDVKSKEKIHARILFLLKERKNQKQKSILLSYFTGGQSIANRMTGFVSPDFEKLSEMVVFFAQQLEPWKTKLNKLLFYADFENFRTTGNSISGFSYRAITMGPVLENFNGIFEYLVSENYVKVHFKEFTNGGLGEQFKPNIDKVFNPSLFTEQELNVLESVSERFKDTGTSRIIEISHKEKAWIENKKERKIIDYYYGFELNQA